MTKRQSPVIPFLSCLVIMATLSASPCLGNDTASSPPGTAKNPANPYLGVNYSRPVDREEPIRYATIDNPQAGNSNRGSAELSKGSDALKAGDTRAACVAFTRAQNLFEKSKDTQMSLQSADLAREACDS